ncbi:ubiquinol-cytochrome c reductase iron-sulfur subunit [Salinibacterium sp. NSLL150]|uniref:cytochrome bc1 complex Rieske iron-sulfur subunit n=1 Tax=unclassified Salinibacterium TaxID=2632331 RepID=UPI0018CFB937|nr:MULTISPECIES: ubiquinol-cytochrome c reductase iron-sulfur subunit [unclassified Salinibacterium]MBH0099231.1 ubiquinol-cytochrome c reductase iron-sulfur subunit [Salinibacterium sp. NSLL35]MBH0101985.1 ubiquinol-cytochrome c reductase iron-sulfur subunit [Salinibacterium sp. NSLL150]MBH0104745.1 ubiquinol-cytochrome c reductase iron-sulfur subunit [Salinibacterium sp. NSLL16]MBH0107505.1 ubiquinol-cytochrome c reductase iron-sulfur subunit [Salinibacterium sp. NSLL17]MBH0108717.1 ubiquino
MADDHGDTAGSTAAGKDVEQHGAPAHSAGTAVVATDEVPNPGFPPHRPRVTDLDPKVDKQQERHVSTLFLLSIVGSVLAVVAYFVFPIEPGNMQSVRNNTLFLGLGITLGLLGIGIGAVHWSKALMQGHDLVEQRHGTRGSEETRAKAVEVFTLGNKDSGFGRRTLLRRSLIGALVVTPLPAIVLFRDLAPADDPVALLKHTFWEEGMRLTRDPSGTPIKASDLTIGSAFQVIPEGLNDSEHRIEEKAKASVLLVRLKPEDLEVSEGREDWNYDGIVAYSKICTHVGCPVALYEQQTHHLLCPCHQSQFDIKREAAVIFGPAKRPLPQLPITVDSEGYLIAKSDFTEPIGPSFWERKL